MTDREKLVEIVCNAIQEVDCISHCNHPPCYKVHHVVDELISHGVTVREPNKPLTVDELPGRLKGVVYVETRFNGLKLLPMFIRDVERELLILWEFGRNGQVHCGLKEYGQMYRFWGVLPTEEERMAAEWME